MFTGIIEEVGTLGAVRKAAQSAELEVRAHTVLEGTRTGDSIAVNGVCLTVKAVRGGAFLADVMPETLRRSALGSLSAGTPVNLERALLASGRLGGHIVTGHIDGTGKVASLTNDGIARIITLDASPEIMRFVVEKGSVAIDGISLTVASVGSRGFSVSVIPHTFEHTNLSSKKPGSTVNIECDLVGKYVERLLRGDACPGDGVPRAGGAGASAESAGSGDAGRASAGSVDAGDTRASSTGDTAVTADFLSACGF